MNSDASITGSPTTTVAPRVTVLMSVYNGARFLRLALESILAQTFRDFEFVIVDDGSTDGSLDILNSYGDVRLRIVSNDHNLGLTASLNKGLGCARGEFVARQDADDVSHPCRLAKQVLFLDQHPAYALVGTQARYIDAWGRPSVSPLWQKATTPEAIRLQSLFDNPFFHTSVLFRRAIVWENLRGYDPGFRTSQDFELWSRLLKQFDGANLSDVLVDQRYHVQSVSASYLPANAHQVETVFSSNMEAFLGHAPQYARWPALWSAMMNPKMSPDYSFGAVLRTIRAICATYLKRGLSPQAVAEVHAQRAITSFRAARFFARVSWYAASCAVVRIFFMSPRLVAIELQRMARRVAFGGRLRDGSQCHSQKPLT